MTDRARRAIASLAAAAVAVALLARAAGCGPRAAPAPVTPRALSAQPPARVLAPTAGEGAERPEGGRFVAAPWPAIGAARRAVMAYRAFERWPRSPRARRVLRRAFGAAVTRELLAEPPRPPRHQRQPALRRLVVVPAGRGRFRATALTCRGEVYLVLELQTVAGQIVVMALG